MNCNPGEPPCLGREHICKESRKTFKATVAMSEEFPLTVEMLLSVLEVIAPQFKHFQKLRDFIEMKLPPGFPVKVDIPVLPTVSARVTFHDFAWKNVDNNEAETAMETNGNDKQDDDANINGNKNEAIGGKGSKSSLSQKEKSKTDSKNDSNDETVSEEDEESPYLDDNLFEIPVGYVEDNTRFPDL